MCESCCVLVLPSSLKLNIIRVGVKKRARERVGVEPLRVCA